MYYKDIINSISQCIFRLILKTTSGRDTYAVKPGNGIKEWEVKIPAGISCNHCILQVEKLAIVNSDFA